MNKVIASGHDSRQSIQHPTLDHTLAIYVSLISERKFGPPCPLVEASMLGQRECHWEEKRGWAGNECSHRGLTSAVRGWQTYVVIISIFLVRRLWLHNAEFISVMVFDWSVFFGICKWPAFLFVVWRLHGVSTSVLPFPTCSYIRVPFWRQLIFQSQVYSAVLCFWITG